MEQISPEHRDTHSKAQRKAHNKGWGAALRPYLEKEPIGALLLGLSSGFPLAMLASTMTSRLAEAGIDKKTVTAFGLTLLFYNWKFLWAPIIERVRIPVLAHTFGQRRAWIFTLAAFVSMAMLWLASVDPKSDISTLALAALLVAFLGASFDIVIDGYRIDNLKPEQLGVGSGMANYGYRLGSAGAGALALVVAERAGWHVGYAITIVFALPAVVAALMLGEPTQRAVILASEHAKGWKSQFHAGVIEPLADFLGRPNAWIVLIFIVVHKLGDTIANLSFRLLLNDLGFSKDQIASYDVIFGLFATLFGVFVGTMAYTRIGMMRSVMLGLILMAISNFGFAWLSVAGPSIWALMATIGFENFASGAGGVAIVAYLSWLCNLRFTATQFALLSAMASILGRSVSALSGGALIEAMGFFNFYLLTTVLALPGILLFWVLMKREPPAPRTAGNAGLS